MATKSNIKRCIQQQKLMVKLLNTDVELEEKFECGLSEDNECNNILTPEDVYSSGSLWLSYLIQM